MLKILYFASLREAIGVSSETITLNEAQTISALVEQLYKRHPHAKQALLDPALRVAINQQLADFTALLNEGDEVALFPPVTGG